MRKIFWGICCLVCCGAAMAEDDACQKSLRVGNVKVCLTPDKETVPSLGAKFDDGSIYYAATLPGMHGGITFKTRDNFYTLDNQYELIHWLSGEDALVDGVWRDRLAGTTSDRAAMNFENAGCTWNEEHTGYYSADGWNQYFFCGAGFDFMTDWYAEVLASVGDPLGTKCYLVDFGSLFSLGAGVCGFGFSVSASKQLATNTKPLGNTSTKSAKAEEVDYGWGDVALFRFGVRTSADNISRAFIAWNGANSYGEDFDTVRWNRFSGRFYLFRGTATADSGQIFRCGPTTIYDIKIWRKK